jgi:hypothetical protein
MICKSLMGPIKSRCDIFSGTSKGHVCPSLLNYIPILGSSPWPLCDTYFGVLSFISSQWPLLNRYFLYWIFWKLGVIWNGDFFFLQVWMGNEICAHYHQLKWKFAPLSLLYWRWPRWSLLLLFKIECVYLICVDL